MAATSWFSRHGPYRIDSRKVGDWTVLEVNGKFCAGDPERKFHEEIDRAMKDGAKRIVVDLTGAHLADDSVASAAPEAHHKARRAGVEMRYVVPPGKAGSYYHMAGLELTIPTFSHLGGAIEL